MKHWILLATLGLSGCAGGLLDDIWAPKELTLEADDRTYLVRVQSDPVDFTYFSRVTNPTFDLAKEDREAVVKLVENQVGPVMCDGKKMHLETFLLGRFPDRDPVRYLPSLGTYQLVTKCVY